MTDDRIQRNLEALHVEVSAVREAIASLSTSLRIWEVQQASLAADTAALRSALSEHVTCDAAIQAEQRAELRRMWWLVSAAGSLLTTIIGGILVYVARLHN